MQTNIAHVSDPVTARSAAAGTVDDMEMARMGSRRVMLRLLLRG